MGQGIAPTIMVARVTLAPHAKPDISVATRISGLQFRSTTLNATQSARESIRLESVDSYLIQNPQELPAKQEGILYIA